MEPDMTAKLELKITYEKGLHGQWEGKGQEKGNGSNRYLMFGTLKKKRISNEFMSEM